MVLMMKLLQARLDSLLLYLVIHPLVILIDTPPHVVVSCLAQILLTLELARSANLAYRHSNGAILLQNIVYYSFLAFILGINWCRH